MKFIGEIYPGNNNGSRSRNIKKNDEVISDTEQALQLQDKIRQSKFRISGELTAQTRKLIKAGLKYLDGIEKTEEGKKEEPSMVKLAEKLGIDKEKLKKSFQQGLKNNIIAADRAGFISEKLSDEDIKILINKVITAYNLDFEEALNCFIRDKQEGKGSTPKFILKFVKKMYILHPRTIQHLREKYKDNKNIKDWMIKHFVICNSQDPERALEDYLKTIKDFKSELSLEIEKGVITKNEIETFVVARDFEKALEALKASPEQVLQSLQDLKKKRKLIDKKSRRKRKKDLSPLLIQSLIETYKGDEHIKVWMIRHFAFRNPKNTEEAIKHALKLIEHYKSKFPTISHQTIERFVVYNPKKAIESRDGDPEQVLQFFQYLKEKRKLIDKKSKAKRRERKVQEKEKQERIEPKKIEGKEQQIEQKTQEATTGLSEQERGDVGKTTSVADERRGLILRKAKQRMLIRKSIKGNEKRKNYL
jgi:hypothetical protein